MDSRFDHINSLQKQKQAFEHQLRLQKERKEIYDELYRVAVIFGVGVIFGLIIGYWLT